MLENDPQFTFCFTWTSKPLFLSLNKGKQRNLRWATAPSLSEQRNPVTSRYSISFLFRSLWRPICNAKPTSGWKKRHNSIAIKFNKVKFLRRSFKNEITLWSAFLPWSLWTFGRGPFGVSRVHLTPDLTYSCDWLLPGNLSISSKYQWSTSKHSHRPPVHLYISRSSGV